MSWEAWATLAVMGLVIVALAREYLPPSATLLGAVVILLAAGVLTPQQALAGFSNPAPITVAALFVLARAVEKTGALQPILAATLGDGKNQRRTLARLLAPTAAASAFLNNTPIVAMLVPQVTEWAHRRGQSPSRYLLPLSYAAVLGGVVTANPFSFHTAGNRNTLLLHAESIELGEILSIKEFESIEISGSIGAELPMSIEGDSVTIVGGTLTGEPPGGVIRYLPGLAADTADLSGLGLATRALSNFEFETLTAEVNYTRDGDLNLQMQLTGRNPDLDDSRPVILNLGVENNISQMLRSLRAARAVEEILERRLAQ